MIPLQGATSVAAYFPADLWYNYLNGSAVAQTGTWVTLPAPIDVINVHQRGGSIIPTQRDAVTTTAARKLPFSLQVALDSNGGAEGSLYWDDGESLGELFLPLSFSPGVCDNGVRVRLSACMYSCPAHSTIFTSQLLLLCYLQVLWKMGHTIC